ncbi:hypothetical protein Syun_001903 [Stephania yunnanensis]|uniref:Pectinesterase n=1 Tax=Stephania yunnanensis TaxID=152371 RepID=A0AAP0Q7K5_9MAGN
MASYTLPLFITLSSIFFFSNTTFALQSISVSSTSLNSSTYLSSMCQTTPYPASCLHSLKLSISISINPSIITFLQQTLILALTQIAKIPNLLSQGIIETQRGTIDDCKELHQITLTSIHKSLSMISNPHKLSYININALLSSALTNKNTCLEGLDTASGPLTQEVTQSMNTAYQHVSNSLSLLCKKFKYPKGNSTRNRNLLEFPKWVRKRDRRIMLSSGGDGGVDEGGLVISVAKDGNGNFSTIMDAINFAPNNSDSRVFITIGEGVYEENVVVQSYKTNIVLLGDGSEVTVITGNRSVGDGWTTFRSATVGFLARDITFENTAGPEKGQAVALRINADLAALYKCTIIGYQDTLYVHSFRQFYRECDIYGTVDFIFGNAAVVFQGCNIIARLPKPGQFNAITAQSRETPDEATGMSIQNCSIIADDDLYNANSNTSNVIVKSYLGRPWRKYSRTVYMESFISDFIDPVGWKEWSDDVGVEKLYYGEYENYGPGSATENRVSWLGYHVMDYYEASNFSVLQFIAGEDWLESTSFPYDDQI